MGRKKRLNGLAEIAGGTVRGDDDGPTYIENAIAILDANAKAMRAARVKRMAETTFTDD